MTNLELAKLDPTSPNAGPDIAPQGWSPSGADIERVRGDIADAKTAQSLGLTPEQYRDLARDPDKGGKIDPTSLQERSAAISAWQSGQIKGPLVRDTMGGDFIDAKGNQWDVKSFNSRYSTGFGLPVSADRIDFELGLGERVIVNTENMSASDVAALKAEGTRRGWGETRYM